MGQISSSCANKRLGFLSSCISITSAGRGPVPQSFGLTTEVQRRDREPKHFRNMHQRYSLIWATPITFWRNRVCCTDR